MTPQHYYCPPANKRVWLISDYHAFHKNIAHGSSNWEGKNGTRPFKDQFEMTTKLAENTNKVVAAEDILIHHGDWSFGGHANILKFREMINCRTIITLIGNHDQHITKPEYFKLFDRVLKYNEFRFGGKLVCQFHYPIMSWNEIGRGSIHSFGHCHGSLGPQVGRRKDIGAECINFTPILLDEFYEEMIKIPIYSPDHHKGDR